MSYELSNPSGLSSLNRSELVEGDAHFAEDEKDHAPRTREVSDLYKFFGGRELEEESDLSDEELSLNEAWSASEGTSEHSQLTQDSEHSHDSFISRPRAFLLLFKGFVTIGILYLPLVSFQAGWATSLLVFLIVPIVVAVGLRLLLRTREEVMGSYADIAALAYGSKARVLVDLLIFMGQSAYSSIYLAYIINNLKAMIVVDESLHLEWIIAACLFVVLFALVWVRRISRFAVVFGVASSVMVLAVVGIALLIGITNANPRAFSIPWPKNVPNVLSLIGTLLFAFEGHGIVIPASQSLGVKQNFNSIFYLCISTVSVFYLFFGLYLANFTVNLMEPSIGFQTLRKSEGVPEWLPYLLVCLHLFSLLPSYMLTISPANRILESYTVSLASCRNRRNCWRRVLRSLLVALTVAAAAAFYRYSQHVVQLMGFFICAPLMLILPSLLYFKHVAVTLASILSFILGLSLLASGVYLSTQL